MSNDSDKSRPDAEAEEKANRVTRHPFARSTYQGLVDQRIAEAEAQGQFRNLPGAGKPLNLDDDSNVPEEDRAAFRLLKNAGFAPPWIEFQKTIFEEQERLAVWLKRANERWPRCGPHERQRLRTDYEQKLRELARMIDNYNLTVPRGARQLPGLRMKEELARLG